MNDLISRQAAIDEIEERKYANGYRNVAVISELNRLEGYIMRLPSVQPERKRGAWTDTNACPFCGFQPWHEGDIHTLSFCPNCGADMRERKEE